MRECGEVGESGVFFDFGLRPWGKGFDGCGGGVDGYGGYGVVCVPGEYWVVSV